MAQEVANRLYRQYKEARLVMESMREVVDKAILGEENLCDEA